MIQIKLNTESASVGHLNYIYLNLYNEIDIRFASDTYPEGDFYNPLQQLRCQQTGKSVYFISGVDKTNLDRYIRLAVAPSISGFNLPLGGLIRLTLPDFVIGIYDYIIYENTASDNLDPTDLKVIYNGLANVIAVNDSQVETPVPVYTEYTTNDSDNENVYLTN